MLYLKSTWLQACPGPVDITWMSSRVPCSGCGGLNRADAAFCTQCFLPTESQSTIAPTSGGPMTSFIPAPAGPATVSAWQASAVPPPLPAISPRRAPGRILWRWPHLWLFGLCAWGVPGLLGRLAVADTVSRTLDKTLVIQILGYFLASVMAVVLVNKVQAGDWGSLGIRRSADTAGEVLRGLAFGTVLIGIWLPISLLLTKGRLATRKHDTFRTVMPLTDDINQ